MAWQKSVNFGLLKDAPALNLGTYVVEIDCKYYMQLSGPFHAHRYGSSMYQYYTEKKFQ